MCKIYLENISFLLCYIFFFYWGLLLDLCMYVFIYLLNRMFYVITQIYLVTQIDLFTLILFFLSFVYFLNFDTFLHFWLFHGPPALLMVPRPQFENQ